MDKYIKKKIGQTGNPHSKHHPHSIHLVWPTKHQNMYRKIKYSPCSGSGGLILTFTYMARDLDPGLQCRPGMVGLATNIEPSHQKYDLNQPITMNNVKGISSV